MKLSKSILIILISLLLVITFACQEKKAEEQKTTEQSESTNEHQLDYGKEEGEESDTELALNEKYDNVRNGARLILTYDADSKSFVGTVENTTEKLLEKVRVEVHLSNGIELGPTTPVDLEAGKKMDIKLSTTSEGFESWTANPEVGGEQGEHKGKDRERSEKNREHN